MGNLTGYLQAAFSVDCPSGWRCQREVHILSPVYRKLLGYAPRADVVLEREDGTRRIWVEFEVSRADPVANHAKFATAHLFEPQAPTDSFIAMVSSHVARGRRNLAANTILLMRHIGMDAHQTLLLPRLPPVEIKRLNHLSLDELACLSIDTQAEIDRIFSVAEPIAMADTHRIHLVGDLVEVICNLLRWNQELQTDVGKALWGKRTSLYFVYDPRTLLFAPAKFCAFLDASHVDRAEADVATLTMTMRLYASLDESEPRFDGHRAQSHLQKNLGMKAIRPKDAPTVQRQFDAWLCTHSSHIAVHPRGPVVLVPPAWFK